MTTPKPPLPPPALRQLRDDAYGLVALKESMRTSEGFRWGVVGFLELVQQEEFGVTKLSDSSWAVRVFNHEGREVYVPGCQIRGVEVWVRDHRVQNSDLHLMVL